jgi:hypothetical protein
MANAFYDKGREHFARGDVAWKAAGATIKATLIDVADYTVNLATHEYMNTNTVAAAAKVATVTLANLVSTNGILDADDIVFPTVSGDPSEALIIWLDGGGGGTSASGTTDFLLAYIDTATGLPVTPNSGNINVAWDNGTNKIAKL